MKFAVPSTVSLLVVVFFQAPAVAQETKPDSAAPVKLPGISVTADEYVPYRAPATRTLTKTDTPLLDIPQSVTVLTRQAMSDQAMRSLADVIRYAPGVTMGQGEGNRDQPQLRGNSGNGDLFVDGVRDDVEYLRDLYNIERVEVPRGSNAMIFGRGAGGGLINRVTKQAGWTRLNELTLQGGLYDGKRAAIDVNRGLGTHIAGRLNGMYENSGSYRDYFNLERYGLTPTLTLMAGAATQAQLGYEHFRDYRTADRGVPSFNGLPLQTDPSAFFGDPALSWSHATVDAVNGTVEHRGRSGFSVRNHSRFADYRKMYQNVYPGAVHADGVQVDVLGYNNRMFRKNLFNQTDLTYQARTGGMTHTLLAGVELGLQSTDAFRNTAYFNNSTTAFAVPVATPISTGTPITFRQSATDADAHTTARIASGYVQDQVTIIPQLLLLAGLRFDNFDLRYHNNRTSVDLSRVDQTVSPRFGLVVKPARTVSFYGSYGVSFLPGSGSLFTSLTVTTQNLEPEGFTNYEVGAKWDVRPGLSLNAAVYRLDRTNTSAPDPADPAHTIQTGSQRSKGVELSVAGSVTRSWQVMAGYTLMDARIMSRTLQAAPGAIVPLAPRHNFSLWNRYDINRTVGAGVGVIRQSSMFAAVDNTVTLPGFTEVDAAIYVRISRVLRAQLNVENIFDVRYFPTANSNNNITPGSPRTARMVWTVQP